MIQYKRIFAGSMCNNDCLYCEFEGKQRDNRSLTDIQHDLKNQEGYDSVEILGGEPAIRTDFIDILNCARQQSYRRIKLVTNGRAFSDWDLARAAVEYGVHIYEIKVAGFAPELHDRITRQSGSFNETVQGILNLKSLQVPKEEACEPFVAVRIPVCTENYESIEDIVRFLIPTRIDRIILAFDDCNLSIANATSHLYNAIETAIFSRIWIQTEKVPLCCMAGYEHHVSETFRQDTKYQLKRAKSCEQCFFTRSCRGIISEYLGKNGSGEFKAVAKSPHAEDLERLRQVASSKEKSNQKARRAT